jgi:hypothetical protein
MQSAPEVDAVISTRQLPLTSICTDPSSQGRVKIHSQIVREYAGAMKRQREEGTWRFPPIILFSEATTSLPNGDGRVYWIGDGFHRVLTAKEAGLEEILAEVRAGNQRDALLYSLSANNAHGLPKTRADKRKAVSLLLSDAQWSRWSDVEIARHCQVSNRFVGTMRHRASLNNSMMRERKVRRGGKVYGMNVTAIGNSKGQASNQVCAPTPDSAAIPESADALGIPLPEAASAAFAVRAKFERAKDLCAQLDGQLNDIANAPGGEALRELLDQVPGEDSFTCAELTALVQKLVATEPYALRCPNCYLAHPGWNNPECKACKGRPWLTRMGFESCSEDYRRQVLAT